MYRKPKTLAVSLFLAGWMVVGLSSLSWAADKKPETAPAPAVQKPYDVKAAIAAGDHKGLAEYYKAEAEVFRKKAAEHDAMMADYKAGHAYAKGMATSFQSHCGTLKKNALEMAEKYDLMAQDEEKLATKK